MLSRFATRAASKGLASRILSTSCATRMMSSMATRLPNSRSSSINSTPTLKLNHIPVRCMADPKSPNRLKEGDPGDIAFVMEGVTKKLETGRILFNNISTSFYHGAKIGIIGKNGAGKSSLLKVFAGLDQNIEGEAKAMPGKKVGYLAQEPELDESLSVLENVLLGVGHKKALLDRYDAIGEEFANEDADIDALIEEQASIQQQIDDLGCWDLVRQVEVAMEALCCPPSDARVGELSGGQKRRVALAKLLLSQPDILLLDEPTNHLDSGSVQWLEQFLQQYEGLVIAITHDRYFLDNVAGYILEIDNGRFLPFKGNYNQWLDAKSRRLELEAAQAKNIDKALSKELQWMQSRANGRQAKGKKRERKIEELQSQKESYRRSRVESGSLVIPAGPRLGGKVIQVENLSLAYDDNGPRGSVLSKEAIAEMTARGERVPWVFQGVSFTAHPGQVIGIVGPNGIGKTTILKTIQGLLEPSHGEVTIGSSVVFGYNAQTRESLNDEKTVWEEISQGEDFVQIDHDTRLAARNYVAQFNFAGQDQSKLIKQLSGGERNRVHLAKSLRRGCNVIMLDEPTNDLDVDTLRSLEEALNSFAGCAFIVSHDRWFLDRVCTDILAFTPLPDPTTREIRMSAYMYAGNYSEFEAYFKETTGQEFVAQKNKRFKNMVNL